jgi:hypothetical protein
MFFSFHSQMETKREAYIRDPTKVSDDLEKLLSDSSSPFFSDRLGQFFRLLMNMYVNFQIEFKYIKNLFSVAALNSLTRLDLELVSEFVNELRTTDPIVFETELSFVLKFIQLKNEYLLEVMHKIWEAENRLLELKQIRRRIEYGSAEAN